MSSGSEFGTELGYYIIMLYGKEDCRIGVSDLEYSLNTEGEESSKRILYENVDVKLEE